MGQFIGLDIHRKFIQVCVMDPMGLVSQELRLELQEPDTVRQFFRGFDAQSTVAQPPSAVEAVVSRKSLRK